MNDIQRTFIGAAAAEASKASHPFPLMAACEAALESNYGLSELAREGNNLFGMKQHKHPAFGTLSLPTREFVNAEWIATTAEWVKYPDWLSCFADRLATLQRLASVYPHYAAALAAGDAESYIAQVSLTWSTDPNRGAKVLSIYQEFSGGTNASKTS